MTTYDEQLSDHLSRVQEQLKPADAQARSVFVQLALERVGATVVRTPPVWPDYVEQHFRTMVPAARQRVTGEGTCPDEETRMAEGLAVLTRYAEEEAGDAEYEDEVDPEGPLQDLMDAVEQVCGADDPTSAEFCAELAGALCTVAESSEDRDGPEDYATLGLAEARVQQDVIDRLLKGATLADLKAEFARVIVGR